jgi:hypothetical protein
MRKSEEGSIEVDVFDKQNLFHLSKGINHRISTVPISLAAIDNRKSNLKRLLRVESTTT